MNFQQYLDEAVKKGKTSISYETPDTSQLNLIKQEINRQDLKQGINIEYINNNKKNNRLIDLEYYIDGVGLSGKDVVVRGACIVETTEEGGYVYYQPIGFEYDMDKKKVIAIDDSADVKEENWKNVQSLLLRSFKKI